MGTFHDDLGELHGITVVVDTTGPKLFIGRCHEVTPDGVYLHDADDFTDGEDGKSKEDYVKRAALYGVWKKHSRITIPAAEVSSIRKLGDLRPGAA